jgi:DNA-binding winged helix-turn-helix (wHTH) protein
VPDGPFVPFYKFGPFCLDVSQRLLLRDGKIVPVTPKAFDTVLALIRSGGRVLEKDELMRKIWPDTFVEEVNLAHHISVLRKALGESENGDQYIQTVPRRGYRFVAPVDVQHQGSTIYSDRNVDSGLATPIRLEKKLGRRLLWGAVLLLAVLAAGVAIWVIRLTPKGPTPLNANPLTSFVGSELQASFSPDGNQVAFSWDGERQDNFDIYVKLIGTSEPRNRSV